MILERVSLLMGAGPTDTAELEVEIETGDTAVMMRLVLANHGLNGWVSYDNIFLERMPEEQTKVRKTYLIAGHNNRPYSLFAVRFCPEEKNRQCLADFSNAVQKRTSHKCAGLSISPQ